MVNPASSAVTTASLRWRGKRLARDSSTTKRVNSCRSIATYHAPADRAGTPSTSCSSSRCTSSVQASGKGDTHSACASSRPTITVAATTSSSAQASGGIRRT